MSLILEALKKSEARRQLGEAPGLGTPFTVARRRRSPLPIIVVLVLAGAALGWYYVHNMPRHAATGETTAAQVSAAGPTVARKPGAQATAAANPAAANRINAPGATPRPIAPAEPARSPFTGPGAPGQAMRTTDAHSHDPRQAQATTDTAGAGESGLGRTQRMNPAGATKPVAPPRAAIQTEVARTQGSNSALPGSAQPVTGAKTEMGNAAAAVQTGSATANPRPAVAPPVPALAPTSTPPAAPAPSGIAAANPKSAVPPPLPAPAPTSAQPAPTSATATAVAAGAPDMPLYYELPFNLRKDLPTLIVSMHVYAAVPAQRFVVIDGERKAEGETIKEGLTLREIRADGIVLEFRGQKFFYPRPGR